MVHAVPDGGHAGAALVEGVGVVSQQRVEEEAVGPRDRLLLCRLHNDHAAGVPRLPGGVELVTGNIHGLPDRGRDELLRPGHGCRRAAHPDQVRISLHRLVRLRRLDPRAGDTLHVCDLAAAPADDGVDLVGGHRDLLLDLLGVGGGRWVLNCRARVGGRCRWYVAPSL